MALFSYHLPSEPGHDGVETSERRRADTAPGRPRPLLTALFGKPVLRGVGLGLLCALAAGRLAQAPLARGLDDWASNAFFVWRGPRPSQHRIVLVGMDDDFLRQLHKAATYLGPELAEVVRHADAQGPAAIRSDLLLGSDLSTVPEFERRGGPGDARPMGQAIVDAGNVVLAQWRVDDHWKRPLWPWRRKALDPETTAPTDFAFVNGTEEGDQVVRRQQLLVRDVDTAVPHFALALFAQARGANILRDDLHGTTHVVRLGGDALPLDDEQKLRINYVGPPGTFPPVPFHEVLAAAREGRPLPQMRDAVVLIGVSARGQQDYHATTYGNHYARAAAATESGLMSGTELHAHILATLADGFSTATNTEADDLAAVKPLGAGDDPAGRGAVRGTRRLRRGLGRLREAGGEAAGGGELPAGASQLLRARRPYRGGHGGAVQDEEVGGVPEK
jgi:CHASE2 domain-containing sensor protein